MVPPLQVLAPTPSGDWAVVLQEEVCFCLFAFTSFLAARALAHAAKPSNTGASPVNIGMQMRRNHVIGLLVANVVRCLSISFEVVVHSDCPLPLLDRLDHEQLQWVCDIVTLLPGFAFFSAFSVVVLFWAQLHYTTVIVPLPFLDCLFVCANITCYLLAAAIAVCTFLLHAYRHLETYMVSIIGFMNVVVAISFVYYGLMVVSELAELSRKKLPGKRLASAVVALSVACPAAFLVRGTCYIAWGMMLSRPSRPADLALCVVSEWFPSVFALAILNPPQPRGSDGLSDLLDGSSDSEAPLLRDEAPGSPKQCRSPSGTPGLTWKQLYPQPVSP